MKDVDTEEEREEDIALKSRHSQLTTDQPLEKQGEHVDQPHHSQNRPTEDRSRRPLESR